MNPNHNISAQQNNYISNKNKIGSSVNHEVFGSGVIIRRDGDNIEVAFSKHGIKVVKEDYLEICD